MKNFSAYLFDLDGTLADSKPGIVNSLVYALKQFGINETDDQKLTSFIGPPLNLSMSTHYGFDDEKAAEVVDVYRARYNETGIFDCELYPNVRRTLEQLKDMGRKICLATSKPGRFATRIITHFGLDKYFDFIQGGDINGVAIDKAATIKACVDNCGLTAADTLMVGDRKFDVLGAKANGIACAAALWGYGSQQELEDAGARFFISDMLSLV